MPPAHLRWLSHAMVCCVILSGCTSANRSNTARTGVEQLLISNAIDQSLDKVNFKPFGGHTVYVEEKYVESVDKSYLVGSLRHRLLTAGARVVDKPEDAAITVELRSGGIGTDNAESFVGTPEVVLPGMLTIPEVRLLTKTSQSGTAKIGLVAIDNSTKQVLGQGGMALSKSNDNNWFVVGVGPFQEGTVKNEVKSSTTGPAAFRENTIPRQVVFDSPGDPSPLKPAEIQFTAGEEPKTE
ncbi:MAG: hypothetical protein KDA93_09215 [Planctomycetaceae bacterium]|nr:hypothetical protein [Planctomycetaceae bacterium]